MLRLILPFYLFVEIILIWVFISNYNFFAYIFEVIVSAILGFFVIKKFGFLDIRDLQNILSNTGKSFSGILLILPFCISDIFGILLLIYLLINSKQPTKSSKFDDDIIDVEFVEEGKNENKNSK